MKTCLSKSTSFQIHSSKCSFKQLRLFQTSIFKFYLLSPISALLLPTCSTSKFSKTCWKSPKLYKRSLTHFQKMSLVRWFWASFFLKKKKFCFVKWAKSNAFSSSLGKMEADKTAKSFPTYRIILWGLVEALKSGKLHFWKWNLFYGASVDVGRIHFSVFASGPRISPKPSIFWRRRSFFNNPWVSSSFTPPFFFQNFFRDVDYY